MNDTQPHAAVVVTARASSDDSPQQPQQPQQRLHRNGHGHTPTHAPRPAPAPIASTSPAGAASISAAALKSQRMQIHAQSHGVKVRPIYAPVEVELEAPEPAPHNPSADDAPGIASLGAPLEHSLLPPGAVGGTEADAAATEAVVRSGLGIMRTSRLPQHSQLQAQKAAEALAYAANFKPKARSQKVIAAEKAAAAAAQAAGTPSPTSAAAAGTPTSAAAALPPTVPVPAPSISYSAALKKSNPLLLAALQSAAAADSPDLSSLEYAHDLPAERDAGNVEYKLKLIGKSANRLVHLTTQMSYRLSEGAGECLYELGIQDSGYAQGLPKEELEQSIACVLSMARSLRAEGTVITRAWGKEGLVAEIRVRRVGEQQVIMESTAHDRMRAESDASAASPALTPSPPLLQPQTASPLLLPASAASSGAASSGSGDLRLALVGGSANGKSSLLGCLVSNERDDARGRARLHVVRHRHEVERGRGSAIARQVIGFDKEGGIVNYAVHHTQTLGSAAAVISAASASASAVAPSPFSTPLAAPTATKQQKALTSLFGGGDSDEDDDDDSDISGMRGEQSSDENGSDSDGGGFGFELNSPSSDQSAAAAAGGGELVSFGASLAPSAASLSNLSLSGAGLSDAGPACSSNDWQRILDRSSKVYTIFDLPGHAESARTTIYGLIGTSSPDYCLIVVSCTNGIEAAVPQSAVGAATAAAASVGAPSTIISSASALVAATASPNSDPSPPPAPHPQQPVSITQLISSLTREQILICAALNIPFLLLLCKADLAGQEARQRIVRALHAVCAEATAPPLTLAEGQPGPPAGALIVNHKIPLLLSPPPSASDPALPAPSAAAIAAAEAELSALLDLLERNQVSGVFEDDIPMLLRPLITRTLTRTRSHGGATYPASSGSMCPRWFPAHTFCPILMISNVTGEGMDLLKRVMFRLRNYRSAMWDQRIRRVVAAPMVAAKADGAAAVSAASVAPASAPQFETVGVEFSLDDIFTVDSVGSVVSGTILSGVIHEGDTLLLGPLSGNEGVPLPLAPSSWPGWCRGLDGPANGGSCFRPVLVKSLHLSRKSYKNARAGQSATLALKRTDRALLRRGMVLLSVPAGYGVGSIARPLSAAAGAVMPQRSHWPRSCVGFEAFIRLFDPNNPHALTTSVARALRDAQAGGGSASGTGLNKRRMAATSGSGGGSGAPRSSNHPSSPLSGWGLSGGLSLRGQPIVHVGNVRQGGEVVYLRPVRLALASSLARVEEWMAVQQKLADSRDLDQTHEPHADLASLIDQLEAAEAAEMDAAAPDASLSPSPLPVPSVSAAPSHALVRFEFLYQSEFLRLGRAVLFRDERTRATGRISNLYFVDDEDSAEARAYARSVALRQEEQQALRRTPPPRKKSPLQPASASASATGSAPTSADASEAQPSSGSSPTASSGGGTRKQQRVSVSSPPLPSASPSAPALTSAFQRTKERMQLARRMEAQAAAAAAAAVSASAAPSSSAAASSVSDGALPPAAADSLVSPSVKSQSQRPSLSLAASQTASPLMGRVTRALPASLQCTPMLSAGSWTSSAEAAAVTNDPLQLPDAAQP